MERQCPYFPPYSLNSNASIPWTITDSIQYYTVWTEPPRDCSFLRLTLKPEKRFVLFLNFKHYSEFSDLEIGGGWGQHSNKTNLPLASTWIVISMNCRFLTSVLLIQFFDQFYLLPLLNFKMDINIKYSLQTAASGAIIGTTCKKKHGPILAKILLQKWKNRAKISIFRLRRRRKYIFGKILQYK